MHHPQSDQDTNPRISLDLDNLEFLAAGKSRIVYGIDEERILKEYYGEENDADVERRAFARLGSHPNIVRYLGATEEDSIVPERGQPLRTLYQQTNADQIPLCRRVRWSMDAAEGTYRRPISPISQKTDIFAYGCLLYEIMTGKKPRTMNLKHWTIEDASSNNDIRMANSRKSIICRLAR
ncbi:hypothetical protein Z517_07296 [Fonsecaea pedrosoi CBS 271.37]|uniref:Protein kinase domain-containing protein n=1 Tax=Fonsecaea pedrosoi CBS 271.37 TaxID=1442368 RepID=A0A0D2GQ28_9EURO|nr:uncharacterized protein Z517_07296 [Fonsecaea pedrosoi CBS 271.37]KIW80680.1 hypothetical protein Z517_07296 [Fonsecaea pedrosoi CBS 271.37]